MTYQELANLSRLVQTYRAFVQHLVRRNAEGFFSQLGHEGDLHGAGGVVVCCASSADGGRVFFLGHLDGNVKQHRLVIGS